MQTKAENRNQFVDIMRGIELCATVICVLNQNSLLKETLSIQ